MASQRIKGITIEIGGDTTKLTKSLSDVDKQLSATQSALKDINNLLKLDPGNVDLLRQKQQNLATSITNTKDRLNQLKDAQKLATDPKDYDTLQREIIETEEKLKNLETEYKNFGSVQAQQVKAAGEKVEKVGEGMVSVGSALTQKVTLPLVALGTAGVASFAEVDKTMQLTNETMGNSEEEAQKLDKAMKDAATNSTFGMKDAATATLNFARAGLDAEQASAALAPAMNLAAGEGGNLDTVSAGLVATINGFHGSFSDAGKYADVFAAACNNSALNVDDLSGAMSVAAPVFSAAGYNINDAALYMGVMANNGIEADKAANSLKTGIARLVSPAKDGAEKMQELGISVTNADGSMKDSVTVQKELRDAFKNLSESEQIAAASAIFGKNQMAPWLALINTAPDDVGALDKSLKDCAGTTDEMAEAMMSGFGGSIVALKSSIDVFVTSIGQALAPTIQKVADFIQKLVGAFNKLTPAQQETIVKIGLAVAAIGPLLVAVGKGIGLVGKVMQLAPQIATLLGGIGGAFSSLTGIIGGALSSITGAVGSAVSAIGTALAGLGPTGWIIIGVIAAVAAISVAVYKNWDKIKEWTKKLAADMKKKWADIKKNLSQAWTSIKTTVKNGITTAKTLVSAGWNAIKSGTSAAWNGIRSAVSSAVNAVRTAVSNGMNRVKSAASTAWNAVKSATGTAWSGIRSTVSNAINSMKGTASAGFNLIRTTASSAWSSIRSAASNAMSSLRSTVSSTFRNVYSAITSPLRSAISAVKSAVNAIKSAFHFQISLPKIKLPHIDVRWLNVGKFFKIPRLSLRWYRRAYDNPMMFNSPTVLQTPYGAKGFGDGNGGEIVYGHDNLMRDIRQAVGAGRDIVINVYGAEGQDVNRLADAVQRRLAQTLKQQEAVFA